MDEIQTERERLSEQFRKLMENKQVMDWWQKQLTAIQYAYEGVSHTNNLLAGDSAKMLKKIQALEATVERLEIERDEANASAGQMQSDLLALSERLDRIAEWANSVRDKVKA